MPLDEQYIFVHIPKTAGVSIRSLLTAGFSPENVSPTFNAKKLTQEEVEQLSRYRLIGGHISWEDVVAHFPHRRLFTFLRDPIDRCLSIYGFFRQQTERPLIPLSQIRGLNNADEATSLARQLEPEGFFRSQHPHVRQNVENRMVWQLGYRAGIEHRDDILPSEALARARQNLRRFFFVGRFEQLNKDVLRLFAGLGLESHALPVLNRTAIRPQMKDISATTRALLESLTDLDQCLYEEVGKIV